MASKRSDARPSSMVQDTDRTRFEGEFRVYSLLATKGSITHRRSVRQEVIQEALPQTIGAAVPEPPDALGCKQMNGNPTETRTHRLRPTIANLLCPDGNTEATTLCDFLDHMGAIEPTGEDPPSHRRVNEVDEYRADVEMLDATPINDEERGLLDTQTATAFGSEDSDGSNTRGKDRDKMERRRDGGADAPKPPKGLNVAWGSLFGKARELATGKRKRNDSEGLDATSGKRAKVQNGKGGNLNAKASRLGSSASTSASTSTISTTTHVGSSKANLSVKNNTARLDAGYFDAEKLEAFRAECFELDPLARFFDNDLRAVRCSKCGSVVRVKGGAGAPNSTRFEEHRHSPQCRQKPPPKSRPDAGTHLLTSKFYKLTWKLTTLGSRLVSWSRSEPNLETPLLPCPGNTEHEDQRIPGYLLRSGAGGGGARSLKIISQKRYRKPFSELSVKQKEVVCDQQQAERRWINDHSSPNRLRVFAADCQKFTSTREVRSGRPLPCSACRDILDLREFKTTLQKAPKVDKNYKYINYRFRNPLLAKQWLSAEGYRELIEATVSPTTVEFKPLPSVSH